MQVNTVTVSRLCLLESQKLKEGVTRNEKIENDVAIVMTQQKKPPYVIEVLDVKNYRCEAKRM